MGTAFQILQGDVIPCRLLVRGGRNSAMVRFESDGLEAVVSRNALRRVGGFGGSGQVDRPDASGLKHGTGSQRSVAGAEIDGKPQRRETLRGPGRYRGRQQGQTTRPADVLQQDMETTA